MRALALVVTIATASGCVIVPTTTHESSVVAREDRDIIPPRRTSFGVELASHGPVVTLRVYAPRVCTKELWHVIDTKNETTATIDMAAIDDPYLAAAAFILAPVTLLFSGLVTAAIVSSSDTTVTRDREKKSSSVYECPVFGTDLPVALTLPSGTVVELRTNGFGETHLDVPPDEPEQGVIGVRVGDVPPRVVRYCRSGCVEPSVTGPALPKPAIVEQPVGEPAPAPDRAACLKRRSELMFAAQQVRDVKERTRRLTSLPVCPAR